MTESILLILFFVLFAGYFSGIETGAYCVNKVRLRFLSERKVRSAQVLQRLMGDPQGLICTTLVGHNMAVYIATAILTSTLERRGFEPAELLSTVFLAPVLLVLAEVTPKNIFQIWADRLTYLLASSLAFFKRLFWPAVWLLKKISGAVASRAAARETGTLFTTRRLWYFIEQGTHEGVLTPYQNVMARNVMQLGQTPLRNAMIPLAKAVLVPKSATPEEYLQMIAEKRFSRMPVYDGSREQIIGVMNCFDFFSAQEGRPITETMRPAMTLPQDMPLDDALHVLQRARSPMGVVVDETESAVGIVTIKDLVEEIVGELEVW